MRANKSRLCLEKHFGAVGQIKSLPRTSSSGNSSGNLFISGARDGIVHVWSGVNGDCVQTAAAHRGVVHTLGVLGSILTKSSPQFYSAGSDGCVKVWELTQKAHSSQQSSRSTNSQPSLFVLNNTAELSVGYASRVGYCPNQDATCCGLFTLGSSSEVGHVWRTALTPHGIQTAPSGSSSSESAQQESLRASGTHKPGAHPSWYSQDVYVKGMGGCTDTIPVMSTHNSPHSIAGCSYTMAAAYNSGAILLYPS